MQTIVTDRRTCLVAKALGSKEPPEDAVKNGIGYRETQFERRGQLDDLSKRPANHREVASSTGSRASTQRSFNAVGG
jgi:hypothetical protein